MRPHLVIVCALFALVHAVGCAESDTPAVRSSSGKTAPLSQVELKRQANEICRRVNMALVPRARNAASPFELFENVIAGERGGLDAMRDLSPPARLAHRYSALLRTLERRDALTRRWLIAMRRNASLAFVVDRRNLQVRRAARHSTALGLEACPYL